MAACPCCSAAPFDRRGLLATGFLAAVVSAGMGSRSLAQTPPASAGPADAALLDDLVAANRILAMEGVLDGLGHVSVRHPTRPERFLLARSVAPKVRVNVLAPGWIETAFGAGVDETVYRRVAESTPLARWGTPEDVADAAVFLASPSAAFLTGQTLLVGGGIVM